MSSEHHAVNRNIFEGKWKEIQGKARQRWGKLTGNALENAEGQVDQLAGLLQQKYGSTHADSEVPEEADDPLATSAGQVDRPKEFRASDESGRRFTHTIKANESSNQNDQ